VPRATKRAFKHGIVIASSEVQVDFVRKRRHSSIAWKEQALYVMRRNFYFQVLKSGVKLKQKWWNNYCITRIGVPEAGEFLCHETFYVAEISRIEDSVKFRNYWYWCRKKSLDILKWLWGLPAEEYSWKLHIYLKSLIVTKRPILSELQRYDSKTAEEITLQIFGNR